MKPNMLQYSQQLNNHGSQQYCNTNLQNTQLYNNYNPQQQSQQSLQLQSQQFQSQQYQQQRQQSQEGEYVNAKPKQYFRNTKQNLFEQPETRMTPHQQNHQQQLDNILMAIQGIKHSVEFNFLNIKTEVQQLNQNVVQLQDQILELKIQINQQEKNQNRTKTKKVTFFEQNNRSPQFNNIHKQQEDNNLINNKTELFD